MKKSILSLALAAAFATAAQAQPECGTWSVIPRLGVTLSKVTADKIYINQTDALDPKYKAGFMAGADVEYQLTDQLALSLGAYYSRQGERYDDIIEYTNEEKTQWSETKKTSQTQNYINVPVMVSAYPLKNFALKVGLQAGVFLNGKFEQTVGSFMKDKDNKVSITNDFETSKKDVELKKFDVSIPFGASYEYRNVILDARYNLGLTKVYKNGTDGKNSCFTFNVAYRFVL